MMRNRAALVTALLAGVIGFGGTAWAAGEKYFTADCLKRPTAKCISAAALSNLLVIDTDDRMVEVMMPGLVSSIVEALAAADSVPQAYEYAESLDDAKKRRNAFVAIGHIEARREHYEQARKLFANMDIGGRTGILGTIADQQVAAGDIADAKKTLAELVVAQETEDSKLGKALSLARTAQLMQRVGDRKGALDYLERARRSLDDPSPIPVRDFYMIIIAKADAEILGVAAGLKTARDIPQAYERALALADVIEIAEDAGKHEEVKGVMAEALQTARSVDYASSRVHVMASTAALQAELGDREGARETLAAALAAAEAMPGTSFADQSQREDALGGIASFQAKMGDAREALKTALRINLHPVRVRALLRIAIALGNEG